MIDADARYFLELAKIVPSPFVTTLPKPNRFLLDLPGLFFELLLYRFAQINSWAGILSFANIFKIALIGFYLVLAESMTTPKELLMRSW